MRRLLRLMAAFLMVCGSLLVAFGSPADAGEFTDAGWWYVRPGLSGQPPGVPEDGLYVSGAPDGAVSIAAVRFTLGEDETDPKLTLKVASAASEGDDGEGGGGGEEPLPVPGGAPAPAPAPAAPTSDAQPVILACQSGSGWSGEQAGSADAAPKVACGAGSAPGERSPDGSEWTWDVSALQVGTTVDVILVAGKVKDLPEGANGSTFQVAFERPTNESLESLEGLAPAPFTPPGGGEFGGEAGEFGTTDDGGGAADFGGGEADTGGGVTFDPGDDTTSEGPALSEEQQGLSPTAPLVQAQNPPPEVAAAESTGTSRDRRALGFAVILAGAAIAVIAGRQQAPPLHGLGPFRRPTAATPAAAAAAGGAPAGGLGRFARTRTGAPPKL